MIYWASVCAPMFTAPVKVAAPEMVLVLAIVTADAPEIESPPTNVANPVVVVVDATRDVNVNFPVPSKDMTLVVPAYHL